jgi:hypothetical protein
MRSVGAGRFQPPDRQTQQDRHSGDETEQQRFLETHSFPSRCYATERNLG